MSQLAAIHPLTELHRAIAAAARAGATYPWIAGVLAGCLANDGVPSEAQAVAIDTLRRAVTDVDRREV